MRGAKRRTPGQAPIQTDELEMILGQHLDRLAASRHIHHAVAAVESMDGSFRWSKAEGLAQPDGTPMTPESPFWIASITKLFTAAAILKLQERGQVSPGHPMAAYLPGSLIRGLHRLEGVDYTDKITLLHLLGHSSGLPDYIEIHRKGEKSLFDKILAEGDMSWSLEEILGIVRDVDSPFFPPPAPGGEKQEGPLRRHEFPAPHSHHRGGNRAEPS